ncbi:MAG: DNRLRE domain-containing protein, partial [Thermoplasmata archaeon]|nr:DNRLRE domain-containing protein [Thermoplasmata archaeon]
MSQPYSKPTHVPPRRRAHPRSHAMSVMLVCAAMLLVPLLALVPHAASDPVDADNPDYTRDVTWEFDTPGDYEVSGAVVSGGIASLEMLNESATEDSQEDYADGTLVNIDAGSYPGSLVLSETFTFTTTVTIQPDAVAGQDTHICQDKATDNFGTERDLLIDSETNKVYRILMRFDVSLIPTGAYIDDAILWIYQNSGGKGNDIRLEIHPLEQPFVEDEVTWNRPSLSELWTTPGGDFSPEVFCVGTLTNDGGWKSFDISGLVEYWVRGMATNNGLIFVPDEAASDAPKDFISSDEDTWPAFRPYLSIGYTIQGNEGAYESEALGSGTNSTFTLMDWADSTTSLITDEFSSSPLASKWSWLNDPFAGSGTYNVGLTMPGWLHVVGSPLSKNVNTSLGSNYLYQRVTGEFAATTSLKELFTADNMGAGILVVENNANWISISKTGRAADGKIEVVLCELGISSIVASVPWTSVTTAHLKVVRDSTGFLLYAGTDGVAWSEVYHHITITPMVQKVKIGLFVFSASASQPTAEFDYLRVDPTTDPTFEIMTCTGNSPMLSNPSWTDWSSPLAEGATSLGAVAKYMRYRVYLATDYEWLTPAFSGFTVHWERHSPTGLIETDDYSPADFSSWLSFSAVHDSSDGIIEYYFSADGGSSWDSLGSGPTTTFYSQQRTLRVKAVITSTDTLGTPTIDSISLTYGTALSTFYVTVPTEVEVGEPFTMDIWAKNSENGTMANWFGEVRLTAMDATGTVATSSDLEITSEDIISAGHVTIVGQRYLTAETITIRVEGDGVVGLSAPVTMIAGPMVDLRILPEDLDTIIEETTAVLEAAATDEYGNVLSDMVYSWTISEALGELNSTTGPLVTLIPNEAHSSGYVNVTYDGSSASRFITIVCVGHPPTFISLIPDQYAVEDGPTWTYDLTPHVYDQSNSDDVLRWYVTDEDLVTASNENKTGNMMLTLTPKPDMYGEDMLRLYVVDPEGGKTNTMVMVEITPVNDAPRIGATPPLVVRYDSAYVYNLKYYIEDVDNALDELTLSVDEASEPYVRVDNPTQSLVLEYPEEFIQTTQVIAVTVSDGSLEGSSAIFVTVSDDQVPVQILSLPSIMLYQGETIMGVFDLDDYFIDPDGDSLHYGVGESHVFINITDSNEVNVYAPVDWSGEERVVFSAIDPQGARVEDPVHVTVLPINQAPSIADLPDLKVRFDKEFEFDIARYIGDDDDPIDALLVATNDTHIAVIGTTLSMLYPASMNGVTV